MKYKKFKLANDLRVITVPMPSLESATVTVWVRVGSRFENNKIAGISHFLEHMAFKGGKRYPSAKAVSEAIDSFGGQFNAGTSKEWTSFFVRARSENLETAFDVLSDMLLQPLLKKEDIEREKGVIVEEINMYDDTPMMRIGEIFENVIHGKTDLGRDIIGSKKTVKAITRQNFVDYRKKHYHTDNMLITVSGGVTISKAKELAQKYFSGLSKAKQSQPKKYICKQTKPQVLLSSKKSDQAHFVLGFEGNKRGHVDRYIESVLMAILGGGMSSRLVTEIREKRGLAYAVSGDIDRYIDTGYVSVYAGVDPKRIDEAIKIALGEFYKITSKKHGITIRELNKAKEFLKGKTSLSLENTSAVNGFVGIEELFLGKVRTPDEMFAAIDKVTIDDVTRVARELFKQEKLNLAIIGPYKSQARFAKLLK